MSVGRGAAASLDVEHFCAAQTGWLSKYRRVSPSNYPRRRLCSLLDWLESLAQLLPCRNRNSTNPPDGIGLKLNKCVASGGRKKNGRVVRTYARFSSSYVGNRKKNGN